MSSRASVLAQKLAFLVCVLGYFNGTVSAQNLARPNIVYMMTDDMGIGDTHVYGDFIKQMTGEAESQQIYTPNLERLANRGLSFTHVHSPSTFCTTTRHALLTGRYSFRSLIKYRVWALWKAPLIEEDRSTLGSMLQQGGYGTGAIGKWHLGNRFADINGDPVPTGDLFGWPEKTHFAETGDPDHPFVDNILDGPLHHGFDYYYGILSNFSNSNSVLRAFVKNNAVQAVPIDGDPDLPYTQMAAPDWDPSTMGQNYIDEAIGFVERHVTNRPDDPFFLYYATNANHSPYHPATSMTVGGVSKPIAGQGMYLGGYDQQGAPIFSRGGGLLGPRSDMVLENDTSLGFLLDHLESTPDPRSPGNSLIDNTLIIFTSDNGPNIGDGYPYSDGLRGNKSQIYDGGHRVPFVVSWANGGIGDGDEQTTGSTRDHTFGLNDLYATFSAITGQEIPQGVAEDSENVLDALRGTASSQWERSNPLVLHDNSPFNSSNDIPKGAALAIRKGRYKMIVDRELVNAAPRTENYDPNGPTRGGITPLKLYDMQANPGEIDNGIGLQKNLINDPAFANVLADLSQELLRIHNQGYSRDQQLRAPGALIADDGGASLRNDRNGGVGYEFTVGNRQLIVTSLGMWDDGAMDSSQTVEDTDGQTDGTPDGLQSSHMVRLFEQATAQEIASVNLDPSGPGSWFMEGEFRFVPLGAGDQVTIEPNKTYALTMSTASGDGDLFHHFASISGVTPLSSDLVGNFVARTSEFDGIYPSSFPNGLDGVGNRSDEYFQHRLFVGPNIQIDILPLTLSWNGLGNGNWLDDQWSENGNSPLSVDTATIVTDTVTVSGNQAASMTTIDSGRLHVMGTLTTELLNVNGNGAVGVGGTLSGTGLVNGNIQVSGIVAPGDSTGILTLGNVTFDSQSVLDIELGGTILGVEHDHLNISGAVELGGTLEILPIHDFVPTHGDEFRILAFASRTGSFADVQGIELTEDLLLVPDFDSNDLILRATVPGDANFDHVVDILDFGFLAESFGDSTASFTGWSSGDFDLSGVVDIEDFAILAGNFGDDFSELISGSEPVDVQTNALVPEPSTALSLLAIGTLAICRRRGR